MPFNVERLGSESIIVLTISGAFGASSDLHEYKAAIAKIGQLAAEIPGSVYRITDASAAQIGFGELVQALGEARSGEKGSVSDPRMKSVFVATHELVQLAGESLRQAQYGQLDIKLCESLDQAIAYAREQLAAEK
jgi:hypothetical protein